MWQKVRNKIRPYISGDTLLLTFAALIIMMIMTFVSIGIVCIDDVQVCVAKPGMPKL